MRVDSLIVLLVVWTIFGLAGIMFIRRARRNSGSENITFLKQVKIRIDYIVGVGFLVWILIGVYGVLSNLK